MLLAARYRPRKIACARLRKCSGTLQTNNHFFPNFLPFFFSIFIFLLLLFFFNLALSIQTSPEESLRRMKRGELIRSWIEIIHLMRDENVFVFESIPKMTRRRSFPRRNFRRCILNGIKKKYFASYSEGINIDNRSNRMMPSRINDDSFS